MPSDRQRLGARGESLAEAELVNAGFSLIERNYRCPYGEIDLIMRQGDLLAFVEVKTRRNLRYGLPSEAVTPAKQRQITRTACHYLEATEEDCVCRFDVVEVLLLDGHLPEVRHLPGVFEATE